MTSGARLRKLLRGDRCIKPASVFDALSARAAAELGYEAIFLAGSVASLAVLGVPDMSLLTLSEFADLARRICRASPLPLLVDADHGYGNALNVRRAVEELGNAGVAGMTLEDTDLPQRFGTGQGMVSIGEMERKLEAALEARAGSGFNVIARTSACMFEGIDAACARTAAYTALDVDGMFVVGLRTRAELLAVRDAARGKPLIAYATGGEFSADADLAPAGVRVLVVNHAPFAAAVAAAHGTLARQRGLALEGEAADALVARLSEVTPYRERARRYLTDEAAR